MVMLADKAYWRAACMPAEMGFQGEVGLISYRNAEAQAL